MSGMQASLLLLLPEVALEKIFSFLSYDEIAKNRVVCKRFNEIGSKLLSRGFLQLEKRLTVIYKRVKSALPRRESERKHHPLSKHSDILQAVETRMSMLNMTYMRYIENRIICFIPGKVLDEIKSILDLVESNRTPPKTHQLLQELRDLSSMAMEHFDEHILPACKERLENRTGTPEKILKHLEAVAGSIHRHGDLQGFSFKTTASTSSHMPKTVAGPHFPTVVQLELHKVKSATKTHKQHISYLVQKNQRLFIRVRRQSKKLRIHSAKIRNQERIIQEQTAKILEQEATLNEVKKHMDEWDQKYKDLTAELVRARDEILLKASSPTGSSTILSGLQSAVQSATFKSNIKPRATHILPKNWEYDRKRKSSSGGEIPIKKSRSPGRATTSECRDSPPPREEIKSLSLNIPDLASFERTANKDKMTEDQDKSGREDSSSGPDVITSFLDNWLSNPLAGVRARKRKMEEDIDLK